jgi:ribosomal protein S18 acetylase RimI-like enzyme
VPVVVLEPLTPEERRAFADEQIGDYAAWLLERGEAADFATALRRAQAAIKPEMERALQAGGVFWTARSADHGTVGWLWVKPPGDGLPPDVPPDAAFLYQILVKPALRRAGYGAAMLSALEHALAASGKRELHLNVWDTNMAGKRLYERAGYELVEQLPAKRHLRKHLSLAASAS